MPESAPKLFISYSWSSEAHQEWVLSLAGQLRENGIDVILDKWDLKEGHDANVFMEKMVTEPGIRKVILICDRMYAEKANGRSGGVGKETQIISPEVYARTDQTKFVAVLSERDQYNEEPFLPAYYSSRIYIDLSNSELYSRNFEQLLRWAYDKPLYLKPALGTMPAFLSDQAAPNLETTFRFQRALEAVRQNRAYCGGALNEYFDTFGQNLEKFRISDGANDFDETVIQSIEQFLPYSKEAIELFSALAQYRPTQETWEILHRFFERLISYLDRPEGTTGSWHEWDFDNFRFIIHELFLYVITILLKYECFQGVAYLVRQQYYVDKYARDGQEPIVSFSTFSRGLCALAHRNDRLQLNRLSLRADLLKQRSQSSGYLFQQVMQADFVLYIRSCLDSLRVQSERGWWPETLVYATFNFHGKFEVFARSQSKQYFDRVCPIFDITNKDDLLDLKPAFNLHKLKVPQWHFESINPIALIGFDKLATLP
jgi:hypothetical protein